MAGSWNHVTSKSGKFLKNKPDERFIGHVENMGDAYEAIEEMHMMIRVLGGDDLAQIKLARDEARAILRGEKKITKRLLGVE